MAIVVSSLTTQSLARCSLEVSRQQPNTVVSASTRHWQILAGLAIKSWGINRLDYPTPSDVRVPSSWRLSAGRVPVVKKVAEAAEKIVDDVSEAFPGNNSFKKVASRIKVVVDDIEKDEEKAEALIEKVDDIEKEMDSVVDSLMENVKKERSSINKSVKGADVDRKHK
ncbi:hypothetical protein ZWY2020_056346 [Hordeum vulgare]|nr:hypothetical protein ZWY2020_056346 [Hordeum vulgare]